MPTAENESYAPLNDVPWNQNHWKLQKKGNMSSRDSREKPSVGRIKVQTPDMIGMDQYRTNRGRVVFTTISKSKFFNKIDFTKYYPYCPAENSTKKKRKKSLPKII